MLEIKNLDVEVNGKKILKNINLDIETWKNYCILWKNWSWKSSLAMTIAWHPNYEIINWKIKINWKNIIWEKINSIANMWIFLAFQNIPEIEWIKVFEFLRVIYTQKIWKNVSFLEFKKIVIPLMEKLKLDKSFLRRDLNVWFSWWEKKKLEVLQIELIKPKFIFLDEIDSWLDVNAFSDVINSLKTFNSKNNSFIIITHIFKIIEHINIDKFFVIENWEIKKHWWKEILNEIKKHWF